MFSPEATDDVRWDLVRHAYGPATDVPGLLAGLRDPEQCEECLDELWNSLLHQSTHYSATPVAVRFLVEAAKDPQVADRCTVLFLVQCAAIVDTEGFLAWEDLRDAQDESWERESWDAVVAQHGSLRPLLDDADPRIARTTLALLSKTGDHDERVLGAIRLAVGSRDESDRCSGWLCAASLGQLPAGVTVPAPQTEGSPLARFGVIVAGLRFGGPLIGPDDVDELCSAFAEPWLDDRTCEFFVPPGENQSIAAAALAYVPGRLRQHANEKLLSAVALGGAKGEQPLIAYLRLNVGRLVPGMTPESLPSSVREALIRVIEPLSHWQDHKSVVGDRVFELEDCGVPGNLDRLAKWLGVPPPAR